MRKLKEKLFLKEYDEEKIKIANKTARASGASALNKDGSIRSVVGRYVLDNVSKDASILDFGSGPAAVQTLALRDAGFKNVSAYDFGVNTRDGIQDPDALNKKYDVVFASNVLNVSSDEEMLRETLRDIKKAAKNEIVFNYPSSPRKSGLNAQEVRDIIIDEYGVEPELVSGTKSAPVWKVLLNSSKNISEDTVKTRDGKWTNRGDSGKTHGEFRTKKQADAQRKAIYASGWKKESVEDLANRVRKNDLEWDDEIEASYAKDGDVAVQFQDRETLTHEVTPYRSRRPRVSSNTWGRIWKDGDLVYNERGPKYKVRDDVIKKLNSMNESFESNLERKLVKMWFNEEQAAWLVKHDPETAEWLAYGNIRTQDLIDVEREINQKMAVKKIKESLNESDDVWSTPESAAKSLFDRGLVASDYVERACKRHGKDQDFAYEVGVIISQLIEEDEHLGESKSINEDKLISLSEDQLDKAMELVDEIYEACKSIYSYNKNGKFEEGLNLNRWSIYAAAIDLHDLIEHESINESKPINEDARNKNSHKYFALMSYDFDPESGPDADSFSVSDVGQFSSKKEAEDNWRDILSEDQWAYVAEISEDEYNDHQELIKFYNEHPGYMDYEYYADKGFTQESFSTKADLFKSPSRAHELDEEAFSGGYAGGGHVVDRYARPGASVQPDKKSYLGRLKNKNPDLVDVITVKGKDIKRGMITQSGQVKEAEVKRNNRGETKVYIMHTNNYDGFWDVDEDMEVLADPENKSKPFTGDYRALLKMGLKEAFNADRVQKRIACTTEFDNGHVFHNDYFRASSAEAEEMARQKSIENPGKVFYVKYDNVMEPCSDIKWKNGQKINESKSTDLEDANRHYPDRLRTRTYWYSTIHGVMPGSVPKGINILDVRDIGNKSYFKTDSIISSKDLKYYDIKEDIPPMEESKRSLKKHSKLLKENAYIKTFKLGDPEFENLYKLADILTKKSPNKYIYYVGDTYFDLGQDWMWTTVLCRGNWSSYQALNPREQEEAILANSDAELEKIADSVLSDKYCPDKKRISEDAIADKIRANQDTKEMTKRAIQILKKKGAEYKDLEKEYEKIYGDKLIFDEK